MKVFSGKVISKKMKDTVVVAVGRVVEHSLYGKRVRKIKKYHVHDVYGVKEGQTVNFIACKPFSKTKKWVILVKKTNKNDKIKKEK